MQATGRQSILSGQRMIRQPIGLATADQRFIKPVPAPLGQFEIGDEIKNYAFGNRLFEPWTEFEFEIGG